MKSGIKYFVIVYDRKLCGRLVLYEMIRCMLASRKKNINILQTHNIQITRQPEGLMPLSFIA